LTGYTEVAPARHPFLQPWQRISWRGPDSCCRRQLNEATSDFHVRDCFPNCRIKRHRARPTPTATAQQVLWCVLEDGLSGISPLQSIDIA
jgi:hypothetical protein